jgi:hypothetical protein
VFKRSGVAPLLALGFDVFGREYRASLSSHRRRGGTNSEKETI